MLVTSLSYVKLENKIARLIHLLFMVTILRGRNEPEIIQSLQEFAEIRLNSFNQFRGRNGFLWKNTQLSSQEQLCVVTQISTSIFSQFVNLQLYQPQHLISTYDLIQ